MDNNFDKLSLDNKSFAENTAISVIEPKTPEKVEKKVNRNIFTAFLATLKQDTNVLVPNKGAKLPNLKYTILLIISLLFISAFVVILQLFVDKTAFIPIVIMFLACLVALPAVVFYYEFNVERTFTFNKIAMLILIGFALQVLLDYVCDTFLTTIFYKWFIDSLIEPVLFHVLLLLFTFLFANFYKSRYISDCLLISACIAMSYAFIEIIIDGFRSLFVLTQLDENYSVYTEIILNQNTALTNSLSNLFDGWFDKFIALPYIYSAFAGITGYLVSLLIDSRHSKNKLPRSMYLLLMVNILSHALMVVDTSFEIFNVILKIVALFVSTFLLIKVLNMSLDIAKE